MEPKYRYAFAKMEGGVGERYCNTAVNQNGTYPKQLLYAPPVAYVLKKLSSHKNFSRGEREEEKTVKSAPRECQTEPATDRKRECGESGLEN